MPSPSVRDSYTHGHSDAVLRSHAWRTAENSCAYLLPHLHGHEKLLDVGAGPGTITIDLASRVGHVIGTEIGEDEVRLGSAAADRAGMTNVEFLVEDVHALTFEDDTFDVTHAHQVLQHVTDPVTALREMARVTKPGGLVAVRDADYGAFHWWPEEQGLHQWLKLYSAAARANGGEPDAGRRLLAWAHAAGMSDAAVSSSTWTYADPTSRAWWGDLWAERTTSTALSEQLIREQLATPAELEDIAAAWGRWAADNDGWFCVPSGEILWRKPVSP